MQDAQQELDLLIPKFEEAQKLAFEASNSLAASEQRTSELYSKQGRYVSPYPSNYYFVCLYFIEKS